MSIELESVITQDNDENQRSIHLTSFYGGEKRGRCLQLTVSTPFGAEYVQLTNNDAVTLIDIIDAWINPEAAEARAAELERQLSAEQAAHKSDVEALRIELRLAYDAYHRAVHP